MRQAKLSCKLLGFALLPRLKAIASQRLYLPGPGAAGQYSNLGPCLTRPIDWELIRTQYDEMVRYATALRREIHEGLNVVVNWNSANSFIWFGKGGEVATNRQDEQEVSLLALHLLQSCLVYINTLMVQRVLEEPQWTKRMT